MLSAVRLKCRKSVAIGRFRSVGIDLSVKSGRSVRFICNVDVMHESFVWFR